MGRTAYPTVLAAMHLPGCRCWKRRNAVLTAEADLRVKDPKKHRRPPRNKATPPGRRRFWVRRVAVLMAVLLLWLTWSIGGALTAPGTDTTSARLAEWARYNGLGWVVSGLEKLQYDMKPPKGGGRLPGVTPQIPAAPPTRPPPTRPANYVAPPATIPSQARPS